MNKREKEVIQLQLEAEEDVLKELEKQYQASLNQINEKIKILLSDELTQSKIYQLEYQKALKGQIEGIIEKMHGDQYSTIQQYLSNAYTDAFVGAMYDISGQGIPLVIPIDQAAAVRAVMTDSKISEGLYDALGVDTKNLKKSIRQEITRGISTGMTYSDIARNISNVSNAPLSRAKTIARTEAHRIQQASTMDAQKAAKAKGADVVKQWDSMLDGKVRKTHRKLDGQIRETNEPFEANGKKAMYPGDFGDPAEDCNCRCVVLTRARWALDDDELQTLKDRAKYFELDKTKDFEEFEEKYLKAAEYRSILNGESIGYVPVTKSSYDRLEKNIPDTWPENQKEALRTSFSDLLKDVEDVELGVECGAVYNRELKLIKKTSGKSGSVTMPDQNVPYIVMHNHPDSLTFSRGDVERFLERGNLEVMFALGNDGSVYMLEKEEDYRAIDFIESFLNLENDYPDMYNSPAEYANAMSEFLKGAEKYGIRYYEGTA